MITEKELKEKVSNARFHAVMWTMFAMSLFFMGCLSLLDCNKAKRSALKHKDEMEFSIPDSMQKMHKMGRTISRLEDEVEFWQHLYYSTEEGQEETEKSAREFYTKRYKDASKETIDSLVQVEKDKYKK